MLGWGYVWVIVVLSLLPEVPGSGTLALPHVDKIFHLGAYLWMAFWFFQLYSNSGSQLRYGVSFFLLSVLLECAQSATASRHFEYLDLLANGSGLLLGALLARQLPEWLFSKMDICLMAVCDTIVKKTGA